MVGMARARIKTRMMNLVCNMRRLAWLETNRCPNHIQLFTDITRTPTGNETDYENLP